MSTPRIYDIHIEQMRDVTQADVRIMGAAVNAYGTIRTAYKNGLRGQALYDVIEAAHGELMDRTHDGEGKEISAAPDGGPLLYPKGGWLYPGT